MTSFATNKFQQRHHQRPRFLSGIVSIVMTTVVIVLSLSMHPSCHYFEAEAFTIPHQSPPVTLPLSRVSNRRAYSTEYACRFSKANDNQAVDAENMVVPNNEEVPTPVIVRAPLKFIGPYPCMALKFPKLATESQRSRNQTGISLDFVLDTAANINTLQGQVAKELQLENLEDSPALPGVSSAGAMGGGETYLLGDSELEEVMIVGKDDKENVQDVSIDDESGSSNDNFEFMQNLTAAALPVVNPGSAGLLGLAFFYCFEGGVEFRWGSPTLQPQGMEPRLVDGMVVEPTLADESFPSITFYGCDDSSMESSELGRSLSELTRVPIDPIPLTQLPSVKLQINGVEMMALLDTGSPVTVLNDRAAKAAGIQTNKESLVAPETESKGGWNPFASVVDKFKEAQATAEAASKGEILMIGGVDGKPTTLYRSTGNGPDISLLGSSGEQVSLGTKASNKVYVGDIPGLAALNGIGVDSPPAVVLGLDVLRQKPKMVFRPRENELYI